MEIKKGSLIIFHVLFIFLTCICLQVQSAKILLVAQYFHSHAHVVAAVGDELHQRGHTVVMVAASAVQSLSEKNYTVRFYQTPIKQQDLAECTAIALKNDDNLLTPCHQYAAVDLAAFSKERQLLEDIKTEHYDGVLCDISSPVCQVIVEAANIQVYVGVAAFGFADPLVSGFFHIPNPLAYVPQLGLTLTNKMTLYERTVNVISAHLTSTLVHLFFLPYMFAALNKTSLGVDSTPDVTHSTASFLIINTDFAIDYPRPITPTTKVVGPILPKPPRALPDDLHKFIQSNPKGTILVSFGTVVTALKYVTNISILFDVFGQLPYNVIWKYTEDLPENIASNIKIVKWLPQNDLLGQPAIKAFITHCGMNSLLEAAYHGVPMVGIPVAGDQASHAPKILAKNVGVVLNVKTMTQYDLYYAIMNVTTRQDIIGNATRVSKLIKNRPNGRTPAQEAADWMEYALKCNGGGYLRTQEYHLSWYQLYLIDVYIILLIIFVVIIKIFAFTCKKVKGLVSK